MVLLGDRAKRLELHGNKNPAKRQSWSSPLNKPQLSWAVWNDSPIARYALVSNWARKLPFLLIVNYIAWIFFFLFFTSEFKLPITTYFLNTTLLPCLGHRMYQEYKPDWYWIKPYLNLHEVAVKSYVLVTLGECTEDPERGGLSVLLQENPQHPEPKIPVIWLTRTKPSHSYSISLPARQCRSAGTCFPKVTHPTNGTCQSYSIPEAEHSLQKSILQLTSWESWTRASSNWNKRHKSTDLWSSFAPPQPRYVPQIYQAIPGIKTKTEKIWTSQD